MKNSPWTLHEGKYVAEASSLGLAVGQGYPIQHPTKPDVKFGLKQLRAQIHPPTGDVLGWEGNIAGVAVMVFND